MSKPRRGKAARWATLWVALGLLVAGVAVYANALRNPFVIDDVHIVLGDPRVQSADVTAILTQEYWPDGAGNRVYRPLTSLTLAASWAGLAGPLDVSPPESAAPRGRRPGAVPVDA